MKNVKIIPIKLNKKKSTITLPIIINKITPKSLFKDNSPHSNHLKIGKYIQTVFLDLIHESDSEFVYKDNLILSCLIL